MKTKSRQRKGLEHVDHVHFSSDDLPELQEVREDDQTTAGVFQVTPGVSHEEGRSSRPENSVSNTSWLTELANIATSPQSPLLQNAPHNRFENTTQHTVNECDLCDLY